MQTKEMTIGHEGRLKVLAGIRKAAAAVAPTLGAIGTTAMIDWEGLDPIVSDDGKTVLANLEFSDKYENMGLKMVRKGANTTSEKGGDGTATTVALTDAVCEAAVSELESDGSNIQTIKTRLEKGFKDTLEILKEYRREVKPEDIERIATISSLDTEVAKLIADAINQVGVNGYVTVEKGGKIGYTSEVVKGARFNSGLLSHFFITDFTKNETVLENPYILLVDRKISLNEQIKSVMDSIKATGNKTILIVADDVDGMAMASLAKNSRSVAVQNPDGSTTAGTWSIAVVKNPYTASRAKDFLGDLAAITGATVVSEESGMRLDQATASLCGRADKVVVTQDSCTIMGGIGSKGLEERIEAVKKQIEETTSEYQRDMLEERLACLTGGIGVIRIGTYTDMDFNEKKVKFDNAINATQAALQEGILPGGGIALLNAAKKIDDPIFKEALQAPYIQMTKNAGLAERRWICTDMKGINFKTREQNIDMFDAGIIDPFKVTRLALESAVHIAIKVACSNTFIVGEKEQK